MFLDRWAGDGVYTINLKQLIGGRMWYGYTMLEAQGQREKAFFIRERNESHDKNKQTTSAGMNLKLKQFLYLSLNVS